MNSVGEEAAPADYTSLELPVVNAASGSGDGTRCSFRLHLP